ncbi:MAG: hypothetical protein HY925_14350 [Elusimicrobia bacterium]|nr:hypothetical protein [Elusimicrobiota bacterium]
MNLLLVLMAVWTSAAPAAPTSNVFVNGRITRNLSGSVEIYEPWLQVNQWVNVWGGGASVTGTPLSCQVNKNGNSLYFFGGWIDGNAVEFGGNWRVNANIRRPGQQPVSLWFTMQISGPTNDPNNPPSFSIWESGANLRLNPSGGGRDYNLSGWVDKARFGAEGVSLVGILAAMSFDARAAAPEGTPQNAPDRIYRVLPFPNLPIKPQ